MMEGREFEAEKALWQGEERWSFWSREFVESVSKAKGVKGSMAMGTVFAMDLDDKQGGEWICLNSGQGSVANEVDDDRVFIECGAGLSD